MKKAKKLENEFAVLKALIETRFTEIKNEIRRVLDGKAPKAALKVSTRRATPVSHDAILHALKTHKRGKDLLRIGKQRDQLLRSLIPLYLAKGLSGVEVNSGAISAFWKKQGISYAGPNAAKALREHIGNATKSGKGWAITPNGIKYVEAALGKRMAA
ncbi:MAG: hypothetical protein JST54_35635 [Deltaproteobacteria bacterium]|nr:hypothetical protein [Deltaproteobacteria bacterium]